MVLVAIVRLRGRVDVDPDVEYTLRLLRLYRKFHATLYPRELPGFEGMLEKVQHWTTWGEIDLDTLKELLVRRGEIPGGRRISDEYVRERLSLNSVEDLARELYEGRILLHKLSGIIKPVFRLHPPKGGFRGSIKKPIKEGGELGYRGKAINELLRRMM
ncbi:MAG: 50S ribosomal protein L30 [Sulfolobales archaeon]